MKLAICTATMRPDTGQLPGDLPLVVSQATTMPRVYVRYNTPENNLGVVGSYDHLYRKTVEWSIEDEEVVCFVHDDVIVRERGWDERVLKEFKDPDVGVVGFGGAAGHASDDIYRTPYRLQQLGRSGYRSNVDDAEVHGERFKGEADVAVLDGFCLCVRREFLARVDGWKSILNAGIDFIGYDYYLCGLAHRLGYRIRVVGIECHHRGGGTSVGMQVDRQKEYDYSHKRIYDDLKDVLPWRCA